jgi:anti-sigma regulatory factor (Ser/Thr protein kinase)
MGAIRIRPDLRPPEEQSPPLRPVPLELEFQADSSAPRRAREALVGWLGDEPVALVEDGRLLLSELVANAVTHGTGELVRAEFHDRGDAVRIAVTSVGGHRPEAGHVPVTSVSGRGLRIVSQVAKRWGSEHRSGTVTVWFELER